MSDEKIQAEKRRQKLCAHDAFNYVGIKPHVSVHASHNIKYRNNINDC